MRKAHLFWWVGTSLLAASIGLFFLGQSATLCVSILVAGLLVSFVAQTLEVYDVGLTADAVDHYAQTIILGAMAVGFFFLDIGWVLLTCFAVGFVAVFVMFGAQFAHQWGETKLLWRRWKTHKSASRRGSRHSGAVRRNKD